MNPKILNQTTSQSPTTSSSEQLIICTQGNEAWYMGAPHGNGDSSDFLTMLPPEFINKIKSNNAPKKHPKIRASAKLITKANLTIFEDLANYTDDHFWSDIFIKITRGVNRKGFKFVPSAAQSEIAGRLYYKLKSGKNKEIYCDVSYDMKEAFETVTNFMQKNGGIVSNKDNNNYDQFTKDESEYDDTVSNCSRSTSFSNINLLKIGTSRVTIVNRIVSKFKKLLKLNKSEEYSLKTLLTLITSSFNISDNKTDVECDFDMTLISNIVWDSDNRKFITIPNLISKNIFDIKYNYLLVLNRDKISNTDDLIVVDETIKPPKLTIKNVKDKHNITINNQFIISMIDIVESFTLFVKYVMNNKDPNYTKISRSLPSSKLDPYTNIRQLIAMLIIPIISVINNYTDIEKNDGKYTVTLSKVETNTLNKTVNDIPSIILVFMKVYPEIISTPLDLLKTIILFKYNIKEFLDNIDVGSTVEEILSNDIIKTLFKNEYSIELVKSCSNNCLLKIIKQFLKNNNKVEHEEGITTESVFKKEGFEYTNGTKVNKKLHKILKSM